MWFVTINEGAVFGVAFDVAGDEGAHGDDFDVAGLGVIEGEADETTADALAFELFGNFGVGEDEVAAAGGHVFEEGEVIADGDLVTFLVGIVDGGWFRHD